MGRLLVATNVLELHRNDRFGHARLAGDPATIRAPGDVLPAAEHLARKVREHGFKVLIWHDLATLDEPVDADGTPLNSAVFGWSEEELAPWRCIDRAIRSPLLRAARVASEPVWISDAGIHCRTINPMLDRIDLADLDAAQGPAAAMVIPVHMPLGQIGAAILAPLEEGESDLATRFAASAAPLGTAVWRFVTGYAGISRDQRYLPPEGLLSAREIECLSWVAHGKTDFEISIILGCSHAGVRYHVTRACAKLGAVNRAQSVFRAAQLGYLGVPLPPRTN